MSRDADSLADLTRAMRQFVDGKGFTATDSARPQSRRNLAISLLLEASEALELFQWSDAPADEAALADELADVMLYLLQLADISGIDLGQAVLDKLARNQSRDWTATD